MLKILSCVLILTSLSILVSAQSDKSKLTGIVYDAEGSVIVGADVSAVTEDGKHVFRSKTDEEGTYNLLLPYNKYDRSLGLAWKEAVFNIIVESRGFRRSEIKEFVFIPSQSGQMRLDIALRLGLIQD